MITRVNALGSNQSGKFIFTSTRGRPIGNVKITGVDASDANYIKIPGVDASDIDVENIYIPGVDVDIQDSQVIILVIPAQDPGSEKSQPGNSQRGKS